MWLSLVASAAIAQPEQRAQIWVLGTATGHATQSIRYYGEIQPRFDIARASVERLLLRAAVGYDLPAHFSFWAGYGYTPLFTPTKSDEHRPYLQLLGEHGVGPLRMTNRTRMEARFIQGTEMASFRARHMLRGLYRLPDSQLGFAAYDEFFVNVNSVPGGPSAGVDQNRLFGGVNYMVLPVLQLEGGYLWNYIWRPGAPANRGNHCVVLWLNLTLP